MRTPKERKEKIKHHTHDFNFKYRSPRPSRAPSPQHPLANDHTTSFRPTRAAEVNKTNHDPTHPTSMWMSQHLQQPHQPPVNTKPASRASQCQQVTQGEVCRGSVQRHAVTPVMRSATVPAMTA